MDTLGSLIDKLFTADTKMWTNQEALYEIRRMSFEAFLEKYFGSEDKAKVLYEVLKKACDLNVQRNNLIDEIDQYVVALTGADPDKHVQLKHKTY